MPTTDIVDDLSKSHRKFKSVGSRDDPLDVDAAHPKPKKRKHRVPTSDVLSTNLHTHHAPTIQDSTACNPLKSSSVPGNATSNDPQLADSATGNSEGSLKEESDKKYSGNAVCDGDERKKERKEKNKKRLGGGAKSKDGSKDEGSMREKKTKKHLDEGREEGVTKSNDTEVPAMGKAASDKTRQKKRKRSAEDQQEDTPSANKSRKKTKGHDPTDIPSPDPSMDESLSDQSRKALSYAYARFQDPPNWKFNKARQIWLIRKLWSEEMIPKEYFPLVTKYLANVEGRIRDTLVQMCDSEIASAKMDTSVVLATGSTDPPDRDFTVMTKITRARSLLDTLLHVQQD